jgi:putative ABC transport system ATP-binding protein
MMNMIGCLDVPSKGKVLLENKSIKRMNESELASLRGKKIGFVFQTFNLIPNLTALDNVSLPLELQEVDVISARKRAKELLNLVDLGHRVKHYPTQLSGGERQRVAVARALANNPDVILADEPTGNLDSKTGAKIMSLLGELNKKEGKTLIVVTHDHAMTKYGKKVVYLKDGRIEKVVAK